MRKQSLIRVNGGFVRNRIYGYIQLAAGVLLIVPLRSYAALTLLPLFLVTVLYLFGVSWREKRDGEQQ